MPNKRLEDLNAYKGVLPYASELFGVYQPLIGWKSKRIARWTGSKSAGPGSELVEKLLPLFESRDDLSFNADCAIQPDSGLAPARFRGPRLLPQRELVLRNLRERLVAWHKEKEEAPRTIDEWQKIINATSLSGMLEGGALKAAFNFFQASSIQFCRLGRANLHGDELSAALNERLAEESNQLTLKTQIRREQAIAAILASLVEFGATERLGEIFYEPQATDSRKAFKTLLGQAGADFRDPFLSFDPKLGVDDVSVSPLGIVHLFRQYFFELDTFLGTPVGHFWLSPGSTLELLETTTRRTMVEKTTEVSSESIQKSEKTTSDQDDLSTAVKEDNKDDLKLGVTATVNQSWGTGSATASASLNMEKTQQNSRETTHKRMRQQSEKISSEMKENYKTSLRVVTENTDLNSKRYVITNTSGDLLNYEFRRKMRQVGVQVQDIGSYLCWETFVDDPGNDLGLPTLVHLAKPADLTPVPSLHKVPVPPNQHIAIKVNASWDNGDNWFYDYRAMTTVSAKDFGVPEGFEVVRPCGTGKIFPLAQISASGEDFEGVWAVGGKFLDDACQQLEVGVVINPSGLNWGNRVDFVIGGTLEVQPTAALKAKIAADNAVAETAESEVQAENSAKKKIASIQAIQERIEQARSIRKRPSDELREEERIIVYRRLIESLMTASQYHSASARVRHILSVLITTLFDVDKMLYFVAPDWWRPNDKARRLVGVNDQANNLPGSVVTWDGEQNRKDNYLITGKSDPAPIGASLGWILQLDGDNLRNAFLNAPWVKAVIPIRPGKEKAALVWLQGAQVEGADGLAADYSAADQAELDQINAGLGRPAGSKVSIQDALEYLCDLVASKDRESREVKKYPQTEIHDDSKVSATPIEKVYEHGFYPLNGGFRVQPNDPNPDPNNTDKNFQVFDQWIEVVPTDQIVPVKVAYDPKTGRQV